MIHHHHDTSSSMMKVMTMLMKMKIISMIDFQHIPVILKLVFGSILNILGPKLGTNLGTTWAEIGIRVGKDSAPKKSDPKKFQRKKQFINSKLERIRSRKNPIPKFWEADRNRKMERKRIFHQGFPLRIVQTYAYKPGLLQNK